MTNENGNTTHQNLKHEAKEILRKMFMVITASRNRKKIPNKQHTLTHKGTV